jgi:hypothetical protein
MELQARVPEKRQAVMKTKLVIYNKIKRTKERGVV